MGKSLALLHVEDEESDAELLVRSLQKGGYELTYARVEDEHSMRDMLEQRTWDIIISDYNLPRFDGPSALKVLRESQKDIPFIVLSGTIGEEVAVSVMKTGVNDYLMKDNLSRLIPSVERELAQSAIRQAGRTAAEALRRSELRYRELFRSAKDGLFVFPLNEDGMPLAFTEVNPVSCEMLGYSGEELLRLSPLELVECSHLADAIQNLRDQATDAGGDLFESVLVTRDGRQVPVEISSKLFWLEDVHTVFSVVRDISDRKQSEKLLQESAERLERAVTVAKVGLWDWDLSTNGIVYSAECRRQIGFDEDELGNNVEEWIARIHPQDHDRIIQFAERHAADPNSVYMQEFRLRHKDGSYRWILAQGSLLLDKNGLPVRLLGSHIDVTDKKLLEEQFQQSQKMESVGRLAGGVAHDFNNLLTVMIGYADVLMDATPESDPMHDDLEQIYRAGTRAAELTQQLLAFSRKQVLLTRTVNLNSVLEGMEKMLQRLVREDIDLVLLPAADLENVEADPGQLEQVILNLVVNACDAMPSGGKLWLETNNEIIGEKPSEQHATLLPGAYTTLSVRDTGCGMDPATVSQIFEPFFTTKAVGQGTGLGLSTVYGIIKQSGGCVDVRSEAGAGTAFKILLPQITTAVQDAPQTRAQVLSAGSGLILLVEDDEALKDLTLRILNRAGYTVICAGGGAEALAMLEKEERPIRLLVTDVVMPLMSGPQLSERLHAEGKCPQTLFISGYSDISVMRNVEAGGKTNFLSKPFTAEALTNKVHELLNA